MVLDRRFDDRRQVNIGFADGDRRVQERRES